LKEKQKQQRLDFQHSSSFEGFSRKLFKVSLNRRRHLCGHFVFSAVFISVFVTKKSQASGQKSHSFAFNPGYRKSGEKNIGFNKRFLFRGICRKLAKKLIYIKQATLLLYANPASRTELRAVSGPVGKASERDGAAGGRKETHRREKEVLPDD